MALYAQHAMRKRYTVICGQSSSAIFFNITS